MTRRAVITGLGIVSPIGVGVEAFWRSALEGRSGIGRPTLFDASNLPPECQIVGEVRDFNPRDWMSAPAAKMAGRFSQFAVAAAKMALDDSGLDIEAIPKERVRSAIGTSLQGQTDVAELNQKAFHRGDSILPWTCLEYPAHAATSHISIAMGAQGHSTTFSSACAAGLDAIAWAANEIRSDRATVIVAGGTESPLSPFILSVFHAANVLSRWDGPPQAASRPFDARRSGLVLAEGAAIIVVEDEEHAQTRGARIYARLLSSAAATESAHLRKVDDTGAATATVLRQALSGAKLRPDDIDYICAHGNSMPDYDTAETRAIKQAFGSYAWNLPISSQKSMCGQALAASSAMQVVTTCLALKNGMIPPTINYRHPDPSCDLDYVPNRCRPARIRNAVIHAHSLGGLHIAAVLGTVDN